VPGFAAELSTPRDCIISTGGGYFLSPSISALTEVLVS
jgi:shikimate kinase